MEDDRRRIDEMVKLASEFYNIYYSRSQYDFIRIYDEVKNNIIGISLDHDLEKYPGDELDPGDGRGCVEHICNNTVKVPVLIHSANPSMADSMFYNLK